VTVHEIVLDDGGMNLLSSSMLHWLRRQVSDVPASTRVVLLRSARPGLFAAGADMNEMRGFSATDADAFSHLGQDVFSAIERLPCATVVVIDGDCFGGALDLALAFDLRFATPSSRFSHPGARLGIVTGFGGTSRWRDVIPPTAASRLFLANETLTAHEARAIGLVDGVDHSFDDELARAEKLDPARTRFVKEIKRHGRRLTSAQRVLLAERLAALYDLKTVDGGFQ